MRTLLLLPLFATPVGLGYLGRIIYADNGPINVSLEALFGVSVSWMSGVWSARVPWRCSTSGSGRRSAS